ncbi:MAG: DNA primase [Erysipelotrichaceae bacterium]|nr:DNA primase [Erysipelotrichaceae bacterium]
MARLSEQEINEVRSKADIVEVISHYLPLNRKGKSFSATCPFHDDHDPSLSISTDKQIFKCFVCGAGGNVFSFVSKYEQISFVEAVYKVADMVGVQIEKSMDVPVKKVDPHIASLTKACHDAIEYTHYQLMTPDGAQVRDYCRKRGLDDTLLKRFHLGYNPASDALYKFLHAKKHSDVALVDAGLTRMTPQGMKDVFSSRLMIPIHDPYGNPVGFTARRLLENEDAKYINTSETDLYHKGDLIFNYHRAKSEARKEKRAYLVEGAMDVLALEKVGMHNAIATLGTACTKEQLKLLSMLAVEIVVCYDGDRAGKNATYKFGKMAKNRCSFTIVDNRLGLDPDEIIDAYGKEELSHILNKTISWIDFLFEYLLTKYNLENYSQKKEYATEMAEEIAALKDDFERQNYYIRLREMTGFDIQKQDRVLKQPKEKRPYEKQKFLTFPKSGALAAEYEILSQMLCGRAASNYFRDELGFLKDDDSNRLAMYMIDYYRSHDQIQVADLLNLIEEESVKTLLLSITDWELANKEVNLKALKQAIIKMKTCLLDEKIAHLVTKAKSMQDPLQKASIADERNRLIRERNELLIAREE